MFKPTRAKLILFGILLVLIFAPLFLFGGGFTAILPGLQIFWLAGLAQALRVPVVSTRVDAFSLAAPNALGVVLVVVGLTVSLALDYMLACILVTPFSGAQRRCYA